MWAWPALLAELAQTGTSCVLVTLAQSSGSAPAPAGAKLVLAVDGRRWGTVGGGSLEAAVLEKAHELLGSGATERLRIPLAAQGQCCGGMMELLLEALFDGPALHVLGAGHVGQELAKVLDGTRLSLHLVDERVEWIRRADLPASLHRHEQSPLEYVDALDETARRDLLLILTHSHELDLELLRHLASRPLAWVGLIGSRNKWRSFRERLESEGLDPAWLDTICCPVGDSRTGKEPREVAIALAREVLLAEARLRPAAESAGACPGEA